MTLLPEAIREVTHAEMQSLFIRNDPAANVRQIIRLPDGMYWGGDAGHQNPTYDRNSAHVFAGHGHTPVTAPTDAIFEILPPEGEAVPTDLSRIVIEKKKLTNKFFAPDFLKLFEQAPKNEFVRGWILKVTKNLPPEDCDTIDKLEAWLQTIPAPPPAERNKPSRIPFRGVEINIDFSGTERGTCTYSARVTGGDAFHFTEDELREMVQETLAEGGKLEDLQEKAKELIEDEAYNRTDASLEADDDGYQYENYEITDSDDGDFDYSNRDLKGGLVCWVRQYMPEHSEALGITTE